MLHRDKAVEQALEKIRRTPHSDWETFSAEERAELRKVLAEVWESSERGRWQQFCFSTLTSADIHQLIRLGEDVKARHHLSDETRAAMETILSSCTLRPE